MPKKLVFFFAILFISIFSIFCEDKSVIDDSLSIIDDSLSIIDDSLSIIDDSLSIFDKELNIIEQNKSGVGVYEKTIDKSTVSVIQNTIQPVVIDVTEDSFVGNYGKFLDAVVEKNPQARAKFAQYFADWQKTNQNEDFFTYAGTRAEREKRVELCYDDASAKFGVGTAIIATTWIVTFIVPGGTVYHQIFMYIARSLTNNAIRDSAFKSIISAGRSLINGRNGSELVFDTINGAISGFERSVFDTINKKARGYIIGSVTGLVKGSVTGLVKGFPKAYNFIEKLENVPGIKTVIDGVCFSENGIRLPVINTNYGVNSLSDVFTSLEKSNRYIKKLSLQAQELIKYYSTTNGAKEINNVARGLIKGTSKTKREIEELSKIIKGFGNNNPKQTLYRYAGEILGGKILQEDDNGKLMIGGKELGGQILVEKGFLSSSLMPSATKGFLNNGEKDKVKYRLIINSPAGSPGLNIASCSEYPDEYEIVKAPGTKLALKGYERNAEGFYDIFADEVL